MDHPPRLPRPGGGGRADHRHAGLRAARPPRHPAARVRARPAPRPVHGDRGGGRRPPPDRPRPLGARRVRRRPGRRDLRRGDRRRLRARPRASSTPWAGPSSCRRDTSASSSSPASTTPSTWRSSGPSSAAHSSCPRVQRVVVTVLGLATAAFLHAFHDTLPADPVTRARPARRRGRAPSAASWRTPSTCSGC